MIQFKSIEEFDSTAKELYNSWLSTKTPIRYRGSVPDWLSLSTYILGLAYYGIALYLYFLEKKGKEKLPFDFAVIIIPIIFQSKATDENKSVDKFQNDTERLKKTIMGNPFDLDASANLELIKENLCNHIYEIMKNRHNVNKDAIKSVVNYVVDFLNAKPP